MHEKLNNFFRNLLNSRILFAEERERERESPSETKISSPIYFTYHRQKNITCVPSHPHTDGCNTWHHTTGL